ncbi:hypothetical protein KKH15_01455 [Patescibacteria group bacterium]|nr:hypothetical protein [Patescibacteria group bacterium]MBU1755227.1 hypothetical protein [Patescibacteria group bacterium]
MSSLKSTRRAFLFGAAAIISGCTDSEKQKVVKPAVESVEPKTNNAKPKLKKTRNGKVKFSTGPLAGRNVRDLYALYIGIENGRIPAHVHIDYAERLRHLWEAKVTNSKGNRVVKQTRTQLISTYDPTNAGLTSVVKYQRTASRIARTTRAAIDWQAAGKLYKLNPARLKLFQEIAAQIGGRELIAYALTELMPGRNNGVFNREYLDFLLRTAGRDFVERIPALYDDRTSFGPYQFTSYALYDTGNERRGASVMNQVLQKGKIPGSVMKLRGDQHFKAAYLFALHNVGGLLRSLTSKQYKTLKRVRSTSSEALTEFIAVAHHGPSAAPRCAKRWLDNGAKSAFRSSCPRHYAIYATKTYNNYKAL